MKRYTQLFTALLCLFIASNASAFCGFFVAQAGAELFNEKSQVILVRDGNKTVLTMSNDFKGDVQDFAMVIPVPVVIKKDQIAVADASIFAMIDSYSSPRMAAYYDRNPCQPVYNRRYKMATKSTSEISTGRIESKDESARYQGVQILEQYTVGEYDIMVLSATESNGLKNWLTDNGYQIPEQANEVLDPYIKSDMKFFVAKVNLENFQQGQFQSLNPLQITYESPKFMLPIRLGMANANGAQDLLVYAFTKTGRIECTNYRTVKIPTNNPVPTFVQLKFGEFYKDIFQRCYEREDKRAVFLEYAWDVSRNNQVKCDPCVGPPPHLQAMAKAGVWWTEDVDETIFFTRLHVRYEKAHFPQDLQIQSTPNKDRFQGRYVIHHPPHGDLDCEDAQPYLVELVNRRQLELMQMEKLAGWSASEHSDYVDEYMKKISQPMSPKSNNSTIYDFEDTGDALPVYDDAQDKGFSEAAYSTGSRTVLFLLALLACGAVVLELKRRWFNKA